jgi:hypothetical protein
VDLPIKNGDFPNAITIPGLNECCTSRWSLELCATAPGDEAAVKSLATGRPRISGGCYLKTWWI